MDIPQSFIAATCNDLYHCRTIASIFFTCALTMFLCTWVAFRPDVSKNPREAWWKRLLGRVGSIILAILAPERLLIWAFGQWVFSCGKLKELLEKYPTCNWTETHAMFAHMGGFQLVSRDYSKKTPLYGDQFINEAINGGIELPDISEDEIRDRGKGDGVAKTLTVIQTLWFAVQAANRVNQGLDVTELELVTLGHVVLNLLIYWSWWAKPMNVRYPINVYPKESEAGSPEREEQRDRDASRELEDVESGPLPMLPQSPLPFRAKLGILLGGDGLPSWRKPLRMIVPVALFLFFVGIFGAIHCLAWNSPFPTDAERSVWRVCALIVTIAPVFIIVIASIIDAVKGRGFLEGFSVSLGLVFILLYCSARICLLILALIALRDLPYTTYEIPSWLIYVPHVN